MGAEQSGQSDKMYHQKLQHELKVQKIREAMEKEKQEALKKLELEKEKEKEALMMIAFQKEKEKKALEEKLALQQKNGETGSVLDRPGMPYQYTTEDLQNLTRQIPTNLYPTLNLNAPGTSTETSRRENIIHTFQNPSSYLPVTPSAPPLVDLSAATRPTGARPKSKSRPARSDEKSQLNCPICNNRFGLTIYQCSNGHSACEQCQRRGAKCSQCSNPISSWRNRALEGYIAEVKGPCPNSKEGCRLHFKMAEMEAHLQECIFEETECPIALVNRRCNWRGKLSQMVAHFDSIHPDHRNGGVDKEMFLFNIYDESAIVHLIDMGPYIFLVFIMVSEKQRKIYMTVKLMGTKYCASKWDYEFHVYNKREPRRKYTYTDVCISKSVPLKEICDSDNCLTLPLSYAKTFVNEGKLTYKFFIKTVGNEENKNKKREWKNNGKGVRKN